MITDETIDINVTCNYLDSRFYVTITGDGLAVEQVLSAEQFPTFASHVEMTLRGHIQDETVNSVVGVLNREYQRFAAPLN